MEKSENIPISASYLADYPNLAKIQTAPPQGLMANYLGKRYSVSEFEYMDGNEDVPLSQLQCVRAYAVDPLIGITFRVHSEKEINFALLKIFREKLPAIDWDFENDWSRPFLKYEIIHGSLLAPMDLATDQPMALEIFGGLFEINGHALKSAEGRKWLDDRRAKSKEKMVACFFSKGKIDIEFSQLYPSISADMIIKIKQATYANVMYPGIGVAEYL